MNERELVFVAGHRGLVGGALVRALVARGFKDILTRTRSELDLRDQAAVEAFFAAQRPAIVLLAAGTVGGIHANDSRPADFLRDNLQIQTNVIDAARRHGTRKLLFLGSSCIYPKLAHQPMPESSLLTGPLEPTNEWYAVAKIAGLKMCQAYRRQYDFNAIAAMPTNLYGPGDNFDPSNSHVLPALIRKFHEAKSRGERGVTLWGTGNPRREFLHVDDLAEACLFLMDRYESGDLINIGCGTDLTIRDLANLIGEIVGFSGTVNFDPSRPDGTPQKLLDVTKLTALGWTPRIPLREGIEQVYRWFVANEQEVRGKGS